jgi:hypothetical protein
MTLEPQEAITIQQMYRDGIAGNIPLCPAPRHQHLYETLALHLSERVG